MNKGVERESSYKTRNKRRKTWESSKDRSCISCLFLAYSTEKRQVTSYVFLGNGRLREDIGRRYAKWQPTKNVF